MFYSRSEYNSKFSNIINDLSSIELTPISLNHDYFASIREIYHGVKNGILSREKYGFSMDNDSFNGEMITLSEAFKHYDAISAEMKNRGVDEFYIY